MQVRIGDERRGKYWIAKVWQCRYGQERTGGGGNGVAG